MGRNRSNATAPAVKGDLVAGTGTNTSGLLALGNNGDTIVADSSTSTGLRYTQNFAAGKNKIINGDFNINQRNFTSQTTSDYSFDRFKGVSSNGTCTLSAQTFTTGSAPVAGYEAKNFIRYVTTGQSATSAYAIIQQNIESVRTLAGQTATISFWAKAATGTPKIAVETEQFFGSGGSPSAAVDTLAGQVTLSTSWARYSVTLSIPSISGKTLGTSNNDFLQVNLWVSAGSDFNGRTGSLGIQSNTFDIWGLQVEAGSVVTAFQTATGTIQGELAACQRYYYLHASSGQISIGLGSYTLSNELHTAVQFPVTMRTAPTLDQNTGTDYYRCFRAGASDDFDSFIISRTTTTNTLLYQTGATISGTSGNSGIVFTLNASAKLAFQAEL